MVARTSFLRLSKSALVSLLETHARRIEPLREVGASGARVGLAWHRRHVVAFGQTKTTPLTVAFDGRAGVTVTGDFNIRLDRPDRRTGATARLKSVIGETHFPAPGPIKIAQAVLAASPKAFLVLVRSTKDIFTFLRTKDPSAAMRLRKSFGITPAEDQACVLPLDLFSTHQTTPKITATKATVVVPVYNAFDDLNCLLQTLGDLKHPILFVDDGSDDPRIAPLLEGFSAHHPQASVISHEQNQGFVAAANTGLKRAVGHVVLLNSDTLPPQGDWVARLLAPIENDPLVATVTPFSNNAEIISVPHSCVPSEISSGLINRIDAVAKRIHPTHAVCDLPTGIGFCMAMNRAFLDRIGLFDPAFGRGYGEEVDWCQKARRMNGRNLALASLFVGHKGNASFGAQKAERVQEASKRISARYPSYDADVYSWAQNAPMQAQSIALSIAWLSTAAAEPVSVFIAHSMGGGAETALERDIKAALKTNPAVIILRVGGPSRWRVEMHGKDFVLLGDTASADMVRQLLAPLNRLHLVYSCGVGGRHPFDAADMVLGLFDDRCTLDIHVHDFFPVSPSWNLLDAHGRYRGIPDRLTHESAHALPSLDGQEPVTHAEWRARWSRVIALADKVVVFSKAVGALIIEAYPDAAPKIETRPHRLDALPGPIKNDGQTIGVLGSLNQAKGAEVLQRLSQSNLTTRKIVVLGAMDGAFALEKPSLCHGPYAHSDIEALARKYDIGVWLIPSICPETFSFTTHEALATGLPVLAFGIGAQGEAVTQAENGCAIQADPSDTKAVAAAIEQGFASAHEA